MTSYPIKLRTFQDETPETSDVVLCAACGITLHAPEDDIEWQDGAEKHLCKEMLLDELARLTKDVSYAEIDLALATVSREENLKIPWNENPLHIARLVKHIMRERKNS